MNTSGYTGLHSLAGCPSWCIGVVTEQAIVPQHSWQTCICTWAGAGILGSCIWCGSVIHGSLTSSYFSSSMLSWEVVATLRVLEFDLGDHVSFVYICKITGWLRRTVSSFGWAPPCYGLPVLPKLSLSNREHENLLCAALCGYRKKKKSTKGHSNLKNKRIPELIC